MQGSQNKLSLDLVSARRIVLAQAIDQADGGGRLVDAAERERIERRAADAARMGGETVDAAALGRFFQTRATLLLQAAATRDSSLVALQQPGVAERWTPALIPLVALVLGILTDQVANPHQVNLLSKPLLLLLVWNLVVYLILFGSWVQARRSGRRAPRFEPLRQLLAGWLDRARRPGHLAREVTAVFLLRWHSLTADLHGQRLARVLHLAAAAWALGVALSLFVGGVWASYGVQWESTFLSAPDVHRVLSVMFAPVTAIFPSASFSLEEVRSLRAPGPIPALAADIDNLIGRRWVFLYAALLALVVVLPRLLLAAWAFWREVSLSRSFSLDLADSYFQRLVTGLSPARVQLALYAHRGEDRAALLRVLLHRADPALPGISLGQGQSHLLLESTGGEELRLLDLPHAADPAAQLPQRSERSAWSRLLDTVLGTPTTAATPATPALIRARDETDVVLHVVGSPADIAAGAPLLQWLGKPVLVLLTASPGDLPAGEWLARCQAESGSGGTAPVVLEFERFARCWAQERVLLDAIGRCLPDYKAAGYARVVAAWDQRNHGELRESMVVIARHLHVAARQVEDLGRAPHPLVSLVRRGDRDAQERRTVEATAAVVERLRQSDSQATASLLRLNGVSEVTVGTLNQQLEERFVVQDPALLTRPRIAGMAGAASGAAVGATLDMATLGLTLGLGTVAGAVIGGGAAWVAAVWKGDSSAAARSSLHLSDDMMQAMTEAAMLRYLAVIHVRRGSPHSEGSEVQPVWRSEVVAAVERRSGDLQEQWAAARSGAELLDPIAALVALLEAIARSVLKQLYPSAPPG